jgi:hypothetical protein
MLRTRADDPRSPTPSQYAACAAFRQPIRRYSTERCCRAVVGLERGDFVGVGWLDIQNLLHAAPKGFFGRPRSSFPAN